MDTLQDLRPYTGSPDDDVLAEVSRNAGELDAVELTKRLEAEGAPWREVQNAIQRALDSGRLNLDHDMRLVVGTKAARQAA